MIWQDFFRLFGESNLAKRQTGKGFAEVASDGLLNDLRCVGPGKPIGYLPLSTMLEAGWTTYDAFERAKKRGLRILEVKVGMSRFIPSAVYVWDTDAVQALLDLNESVLATSDWPTKAEEFVTKVICEQANPNDPVNNLISHMFANELGATNDEISVPEGFQMPVRGFSGLIWSSPENEAAARRHCTR
jgi:hypothetical protein